jgi:hypothetical protein
MRKPSLNLSPRQTIALSIFGALIAAADLDLLRGPVDGLY